MLREERLWRMTQQLLEERKVLCSELAEQFGLTEASIRLDLTELERRGLARRVYGGAVLPDSGLSQFALSSYEPRFAERIDVQRAEKQAIGRAAAGLINDGETIMIDGGTTTFQVCYNLGDKDSITIISCVLNNLWQELAQRTNLQIFLTGGYLRAESLSLVGEVAENMLRGFRASKAILGIDGISLEHGLTTVNFLEAGVKKRMIEASQELIIVADHTKFDKIGLIPVAPVMRANKIITDSGTSPEVIAGLRELGIEVVIAA